MSRAFIPAFLLPLFVLAFAIPAASAYAQTCTPACSGSQTCIFVGTGSQTQCITSSTCTGSDCTAGEVVVTPSTMGGGTTFKDLVNNDIVPIGNQVIVLLYAIALMLFFYGIFKFFFRQSDPKARAAGKQFMIFGIIGLFVLFSVWGLVNLLLSSVGTI